MDILRITNPDNTLRRDYSAARNEMVLLSCKSRQTETVEQQFSSAVARTSAVGHNLKKTIQHDKEIFIDFDLYSE